MKFILQILLFFLLVTQLHFSQWTNQNLAPNNNDLWSTFFTNDSIGWIVGSGGFIKKTTNAGNEWIQQYSGTTSILKSVQFVDQNTGWICGEAGLILKTTDSGTNWDSITSGTTEHLSDIHFYDTDTGYVVGFNGTILKTTNGGSSWISLYSGTSNDLYSMDFVDAFIGYAAGEVNDTSSVVKTTDGGASWIDKSSGFPATSGKCFAVDFINANVGFIGRDGSLLKTTDGGETWSPFSSPPSVDQTKKDNLEQLTIYPIILGINSIYFSDTNNGWYTSWTGMDNYIYSTTNGGISWEYQKNYWEHSLLSVFVTQDGTGLAVGAYGLIYLKAESDSKWSRLLSGTNDRVYSIYFVDGNIGWAGGTRYGNPYKSVLLKTTNGGKQWKTKLELYYSGSYWRSVYFINEVFGWAALSNGIPQTLIGGGLYRTTDGGENWIATNTSGDYSSVFFINQDTGWVTSDYGSSSSFGIYKSTDGGITLVKKSSISSSSIYFLDINTGWAVGTGGSILKSTDEGETWVSKASGTANNLNCIKFYTSDLGMCVGNAGTVLLSTDGGESWIPQNVGTTNTLKSVGFTNSTTVWIAGYNGTILNSTDLGYNWTSYDSVTTNNLTSLSFINEYTGWVGGLNGTMFNYSVEPIPSVTLTSPNGGEMWAAGEQKNITWTSSSVSTIKIDYTTDNGTDWIEIANNISAMSGSYLWTVPNTPSPQCKIRITDEADSNFYDISNSSFFILNSSGLIGYYPFNGNANDESGNGNDGIINGAILTSDRFNNSNTAYYFNGSSYIRIIHNPIFNFGNSDYSISCWAMRSENTYYQQIICKELPEPTYTGWYLRFENNFISFVSGTYFNGNWYTNGIVNSNTILNDLWYHIVGVFKPSNGTVSLYINGELMNTVSSSVPPFSSDNINDLMIGVYQPVGAPSGPEFLTGRIDDIYIYNRALSDSEIQRLYIELPPTTPELISPANNTITIPLIQAFSWHSSLRKENYHIQIGFDSLFTNLAFEDSTLTDTTTIITPLNYNNRYYWRVKAKNIIGDSDWSEVWQFNTIIKIPTLSLISGGGQVILNWIQEPNNNISSFKIFRDTIPSANSLLAIVDSNQISYADTNFIENTYYYYRIKAVSIYGLESDFSNEVSGIPIETFQLAVYIDNSWNIVSIPGLLPFNQNVTTWWSGKDPGANVFKYQGSYQSVTTVQPGVGYWMKHVGSNLYNTGEEWAAIGIQLVPHNPINALTGWNLIGGYEDTVATAIITTTPPGLRTGPMFRYFDGYYIADYIEPGHGYWIKLTAAGQINIPEGISIKTGTLTKSPTEGFSKITITDNTGRNYTLYVANEEVDLSQFELPPLPPPGMFDIRYSSQRFVERLTNSSQSIDIAGAVFPLSVKAVGIDIILRDETDKEIARIKDGQEVTLKTSVNRMKVSANAIPAEYSLEQNFPNPFNPSTVIEFSLPEDVANVKLSIYNALGEKVTELVNTSLTAGKYLYQWNAQDVATGIYFYELRTDKFISVKKMLLIK